MNRVLRSCQGVLVILFFCILISVVGISCSENARDSINVEPTLKINRIQEHLSDVGRAIYSNSGYYHKYQSDAIALWMIEKHLGEMVELMKEAKQP